MKMVVRLGSMTKQLNNIHEARAIEQGLQNFKNEKIDLSIKFALRNSYSIIHFIFMSHLCLFLSKLKSYCTILFDELWMCLFKFRVSKFEFNLIKSYFNRDMM